MWRIGVGERRARLVRRQLLAPGVRAEDPAGVADALVAYHSTDPASVYLSARARLRAPSFAAVDAALYEDRSLVRMLGMRRTVFVVTRALAPVVQAACTRAIAADERRKLHALLVDGGVTTEPEPWLKAAEQGTLTALRARGEALATELSQDEPLLREQLVFEDGPRGPLKIGASTRVLFLLAADGLIVRGRPRGSWISSQYRWATTEYWLGAPLADLPTPDAQAALARAWLRAFGPAPLTDLRWWAKWTARDAQRAVNAIGAVEVDLDGTPGWVLPDDLDPVEVPDPAVALLPALDPTPMGWFARDWFLGPHKADLFDRTGNIGPTVWWDGRIVGGWAQRKDGEVVVRLLEDAGAEAAAAAEAEAARLTGWLGATRVTPRFRTPLEKTLLA